MSEININDINPNGIELFTDSESFLDELNENQSNDILGGRMALETNTWAETCCKTGTAFTDTMVGTCGTSPAIR
jgi:hypothetical protein